MQTEYTSVYWLTLLDYKKVCS